MSKFNYAAYEDAIRGLAELPNEMLQSQQKMQANLQVNKQQIDAAVNKQLEELSKAENLALQQFDDVACEYKVLFSVPVSRPGLVPTPLSVSAALDKQNTLAKTMKVFFNAAKQAAVEKKRQQIEAAKAEQRRLAAIKAAEEEDRRRQEEEAERRREEEYLKELSRHNRSAIQKFFDFLTGQ